MKNPYWRGKNFLIHPHRTTSFLRWGQSGSCMQFMWREHRTFESQKQSLSFYSVLETRAESTERELSQCPSTIHRNRSHSQILYISIFSFFFASKKKNFLGGWKNKKKKFEPKIRANDRNFTNDKCIEFARIKIYWRQFGELKEKWVQLRQDDSSIKDEDEIYFYCLKHRHRILVASCFFFFS